MKVNFERSLKKKKQNALVNYLMEENVIDFITRYISLTDGEIEIIKKQNLIKAFPKGTVLLKEGEFSKDCYFILKGCLRNYYLVDGEEKSTEFYIENEAITPVSYIAKQPSEYYISCLEDSVLVLGSEDRNRILIEQIPKLESLVMQLNTNQLVQQQISFDTFKKLSPEMRYLHLLEKRPELVNRVPLYHLATYLGITSVSLSRMRNRIAKTRKG